MNRKTASRKRVRMKRMNSVEEMIYASAYARRYAELIHNPPRELLLPALREEWAAWEREQTVNAIEHAANAVISFREAEADVAEGWRGTEVFDMYVDARRI